MRCHSLILAIMTLALASLEPTPASAQRRLAPPSPETGGRGFFMIGVEQLDLTQLNEALATHGYPTFSERFLSLGGGGFAIRDRLIIGAEGHAVVQSDKTTADGEFRTRVMGGYGMFDIGYHILRAGRVAFYPIIGIGGGATALEITERSTLDFEDVLDQPRRGARVTSAALLVGGGLGVEYFVAASRTRRGGFIIGARAGFNYAPLESNWKLDRTDIAGGPDAGFTGPYVRVAIGGGSR
jgi:hypothetical protein